MKDFWMNLLEWAIDKVVDTIVAGFNAVTNFINKIIELLPKILELLQKD